MRIIAMVVAKNEAHRYLRPFLHWTATFTDAIYLYDDQSDDGTVAIAMSAGAFVGVRSDEVPSFVEHEGKFRQAAWEWMERVALPREGDWVICLDADEFLVAEGSEREALEDAAASLNALGATALNMEIPEIFAEVTSGLYRRVDGFWGTITGVRYVAWREGGQFADKALGCGSVPTYAHVANGPGPWILHVGYLDPEDRQEKYDRYMALPGHASTHVQSILLPGTIELWTGPLPLTTLLEHQSPTLAASSE